MKILGIAENDTYIASITKSEIEKILNKYYGQLQIKLKEGVEIDVTNGYDFCMDIQLSCGKMVDAMRQFEKAKQTLMEFALMVGKLDQDDQK